MSAYLHVHAFVCIVCMYTVSIEVHIDPVTLLNWVYLAYTSPPQLLNISFQSKQITSALDTRTATYWSLVY